MEGAGEEAIDATEITRIQGKDGGDPSPKSNSSNRQEMFLPPSQWRDNSDGLVGNYRCMASDPPSISMNSMNDGADMVEELTLTTNDRSNLVVVGREGLQIRQGQWQHLYQLGGGSANGNNSGNGYSRFDNVSKDKEPATTTTYGGGNTGNAFPPDMWIERHMPGKHSEISKRLVNSDVESGSPSGVRTRNISASGFSQFFVKNSLKGKGTLYGYPQRHDKIDDTGMGHNNDNTGYVGKVVAEASPNLGVETNRPYVHSIALPGPVQVQDGVSLREWIKPGRVINKSENMHIFRQIVELVDLAHSQQVALLDVRPSCFNLLPSNKIKYVGSFGEKESLENAANTNNSYSTHRSSQKRFFGEALDPYNLGSKQHKLSHDINIARRQCKFAASSGYKLEATKGVDMIYTGTQDSRYGTIHEHGLHSDGRLQKKSNAPIVSSTAQEQLIPVNIQLEEKWYISPEELNGRRPSFPSDIYRLGVLLFEMFCCFESWEMHAATLLDLRHRILPPFFLSEYSKEAGFCLWLLHPEPSSRPTTRDILLSELISESQESPEDQLLSPIDEDDAESELLLHFLISLKEHKHKHASKLVEDIECLEADIEEVEKRHFLRGAGFLSWKQDSPNKRKQRLLPKEYSPSQALSMLTPVLKTSQARLMKNINQLENAYFSMRSQIHPGIDCTGRTDKDVLKNQERCFLLQNENEEQIDKHKSTDRVGVFFDGLCKYARYSKFEVRGTLRNKDLLNSANVICSLSFDRDEDYFAAAGVSKKIKIFEFQGLLNDSIDIHYPVVEMSNKSKLSCVCWNNYIKNYLASTDYDGVVQLWDVNTGQGFSQYTDHEKRAWSVDFSPVDPTKLASGSDDFSVKLWTINERKCISTIKTTANVCCVQFSTDSTHLLAFGSADYRTYCYDIRNTRNPWCTLSGHGKAVSYVKFIDSETVISASTDNTLKLWDLNKSSSTGLSTDACSLTFKGHTNEKNFVGLSVSDGYIACGSETNEVYAYYKSLPMPITSHKFGSIDPISGHENSDDNGQFVSNVCWRGKSDMVVAANSSGIVLPMSPRKCRSGGRERRIRDRPSPLGPNGKMEVMSHISPALGDGSVKIVTENGDVNLCDFQRPVQRYEELAEQPGNEQDSLLQRPTKRLRSKKSPDDSISVHSKGHGEAVTIEDREGMQQSGNSNTARHPIHAPLGIPFCSASVGGTRRVLPSYNSSGFILSSESGVIFDTETLRRRMEQIVEAQGLGRVSLDCANLLNNGLDVYLKRLIRSCIELVGSRFGHEPQKQPVHGQQPHGLLNGIWPGHQLQMQSCGEPVEGMQERRTSCPISLLDFKVAMELNPQQLGEDWPLLLEKICMRACEE